MAGNSDDQKKARGELAQHAFETAGRPGVGLGLAIVKSIAHAHGGTLTITARPADGLRLAVTAAPMDRRELHGQLADARAANELQCP
ncbi:sensor histidine kinase [Nonomuraea sp. NPDC050451]|uniref:sensor histidine kinase n=1 Tax=Nonomuraea sp. NPDC050451 TaxID=3364364 RepID=UPI0037ADFF70